MNKDGTSQTCPNCGAHTGKKTLDVRVHHCIECEYTTTRDVAASQEIRNRGIQAVGQIVLENVCRLTLLGVSVTVFWLAQNETENLSRES